MPAGRGEQAGELAPELLFREDDLGGAVAEAGPDDVAVDRAQSARGHGRPAHLERRRPHGAQVRQRDGVELALLVRVREHPADARLAQLADRQLGLVGEPENHRPRALPGRPLGPAHRIDGRSDPEGRDGPDQDPGGDSAHYRSGRVVARIAHVQVVVVVPENLHDAGRAREAGIRADVDEVGARRDEAVEEVLREPAVDLRDELRRPLATVAARVVDVRIEPVLVCRVHGPERAAARLAQVADPYSWSLRVGGRVAADHTEEEADEPVACPTAARRGWAPRGGRDPT